MNTDHSIKYIPIIAQALASLQITNLQDINLFPNLVLCPLNNSSPLAHLHPLLASMLLLQCLQLVLQTVLEFPYSLRLNNIPLCVCMHVCVLEWVCVCVCVYVCMPHFICLVTERHLCCLSVHEGVQTALFKATVMCFYVKLLNQQRSYSQCTWLSSKFSKIYCILGGQREE